MYVDAEKAAWGFRFKPYTVNLALSAVCTAAAATHESPSLQRSTLMPVA